MRMTRAGAFACALFTSVASAQEAATALALSPDQEARVRRFVASENRTSAAVPGSFKLSVGAEVPGSVVLYTFDEESKVEQYQYAIIGGKTVIVDPSSREVVRVLDSGNRR